MNTKLSRRESRSTKGHSPKYLKYKLGSLGVFFLILFLACPDPSSTKQYTVVFNTGGESASLTMTQVVNSGKKATQPAAPSRASYSFGGWYKDQDFTQKFDFASEVITANIILYAKWDRPTLSFDTGGGSLIDVQTVDSSGKATQPATPSRTGYSFDNWYKDEAHTEVFDFSSEIISSSITIYAKWSIANNLLSFDTGGAGASLVAPQAVDSGALATQPATPSRTGYSFDNWYKDEAHTEVFDFSSEIISASITIYAKWSIATNTLSFDTGGGSRIDPQTVDSGALASKPATPTRTGYSFDNWYKDEAHTEVFDFSSEIISSSITIYAKWSIVTNLLSFDTGGGSRIDPQTVDSGALASKPATPTRTGYSFDNWYKDEAHTEVFDFSSEIISSSITIYAKWSIVTNLLSFDTGGGSRIDPQTVDSGTLASKPATPTRTGYSFDNWYKDEAHTEVFDFSSEIISSSITIYAKWSIVTNLLSFDTGGGSRIDPQTVDSGALASKPATPTRTGYSFDNWYKDEAYKQVFDFSSEIISASITIYAKWTIVTNLLSFDTGGAGASLVAPQTVNSGALATQPATPSRTGYNFDNWYKDEAHTEVFDFSSEIISSSITIYAKWSLITNTLSFDLRGGSGDFKPITVATGSPATNPTPWPYRGNTVVPQKTVGANKLLFGGWYTESDPAKQNGKNKFDFTQNINADLTVYARWYTEQPRNKVALQTLLNRANASTDLSLIDVRKVTNMDKLIGVLDSPTTFNYDIGGWDTSAVTSMELMFGSAAKFNQDIGNWDTSAVTNMRQMFLFASEFNQDIGNWETSAVTDMRNMLQSAAAFNQDIGAWKVGAVDDMSFMFANAVAFNQDLTRWADKAGRISERMFTGASSMEENNKPSWSN